MVSQATEATQGSDDTDTGLADGTTDSTTDDGDDAADELAARFAGYVDRNELARFGQDVNRQLGHVSAVQRAVAKVERAHAGTAEAVTAQSQLLSVVARAILSQLPDDSSERSQLVGLLDDHRSQAQVAKILADKLGGFDDDDEDPSDDESLDPAWVAANGAVEAYAEGKGIDPALIPDTEFLRVQAAVEARGGGPREAVAEMKKVVDAIAARQGRRDTRKDTATGTPPRGGKVSGGAGLTADKMRGMSVEELRKIPEAERFAALSR